jgi:hypothetical protein
MVITLQHPLIQKTLHGMLLTLPSKSQFNEDSHNKKNDGQA